jgi:hypothetical protein
MRATEASGVRSPSHLGLLALPALLLLAACGGSSPAPAASPSSSPPPTALTLPAACRILRTDIVGNGGTPDRATLQQVIDHAASPYLVIDAQNALKDIGSSDGGLAMGMDLAFMQRDCRRTGVQIPQGGTA